jgi:hypothetical protein
MKKLALFCCAAVTAISFNSNAQTESDCPAVIPDPGAGLFLSHGYAFGTSIWTFDPAVNNPISITANNELFADDVTTGSTIRVYTNAANILPNGGVLSQYSTKLRAEFKVHVTTAKCPSHLLLGFSSGSSDITAGGVFPNDAIGVMLTTDESIPPANAYTCDEVTDVVNPWKFKVMTRYGNSFFSTHSNPDYITVPAIDQDYYVRLIRSGTDICLSVCTDATFTQHVPGSPDCFEGIVTLDNGPYYFVQHGGRQGAYNYRRATYTIDNLKVFAFNNQYGFDCSQRQADASMPDFKIHPNPSSGLFEIQNLPEPVENILYAVVKDMNGSTVKEISVDNISNGIDISTCKDGVYIFEIVAVKKTYQHKLVLSR